MLILLANTKYLVDGIEMTFLETIDNGEVSVFEIDNVTIKFNTKSLMEMDIEEID